MKNKKLYFNKEIYKIESIQEAMNAYSEICRFDCAEREKYYELIISDEICDYQIISMEMENYLIGIEGKNGF